MRHPASLSLLLITFSLSVWAVDGSPQKEEGPQKVAEAPVAPAAAPLSTPSTPAAPSAPAEMNLADAMANDATGFEYDGLEENHVELLKEQAEAFVRYRRKKMDSKEKVFWLAECFSIPKLNVFCNHMIERDDRPPSESRAERRARMQAGDVFKISESFSRADLASLQAATMSQLQRALKLFPNWEPLKPATDAVLAQASCPSSALLTALGQKAEEFFPAPEFRTLATKLYLRSAECASSAKDEWALRGRYRAALLQIWSGECQAAMKGLQPLADDREGEFNSRSLYWRAYCAEREGNKLQALALKGRLMKEYPLSYHGLILSRGVNKAITQSLDLTEPRVRFRSAVHPEINAVVRGAEVLLELDANDLAAEMLSTIADETETAETSFRLYFALLLKRSGDAIGQFRALATLFRAQPDMISRDALQMFYPLKRFDTLKAQAARIDPLLVAALIRQESGFNERARSPAGAQGLMQLMPQTARRMERGAQKRLLDPNTNIRLGVRYFYGLIDRFDGDAELALAGYNAGPERVDEWKRRYTTDNRMLFLDLIPFKETRDYVSLISRNYYWYLSLYGDRDVKLRDENGRRPAAASKNPLVLTLFKSF